jgi:hypothetical protein
VKEYIDMRFLESEVEHEKQFRKLASRLLNRVDEVKTFTEQQAQAPKTAYNAFDSPMTANAKTVLLHLAVGCPCAVVLY